MKSPPILVGLTGGIGSGKSTVSQLFQSHGATLIDADEVSRALTGPHGVAGPAIAQEFGATFLAANGALDRAAMRALVFSDKSAKRRLEALLHPLIRERMLAQWQAMPEHTPYVLWSVPLLVEHIESHRHCDRICVVDCDPAIQVERVKARSGLDVAEINRIISAQASRTRRLSFADDVIDNSGAIEQLIPQVKKLDTVYRSLR